VRDCRSPRHRPARALIRAAAGVVLLLAGTASGVAEAPTVRIGSKKFTESVILGEIATQLAASTGASVRHSAQLGGTRVLWSALVNGDIDAYPEYTGTLRNEIFAGVPMFGDDDLTAELARSGVRMTAPIGFDNTYAIGMRADRAAAAGITKISDLAEHPEITLAFTNEFMDRADGWPGLRERYMLPQDDVRGLDHDLAYRGLISGRIDAMDIYSTDAEIAAYGLVVLDDDLGYFPDYQAVLLYRSELAERAPDVIRAFGRLENAIPEATMIELNARAKIHRMDETRIAARFVESVLGVTAERGDPPLDRQRILNDTIDHLYLVAVSLGAAILVALPFGILAARRPLLGRAILAAVGIVQTIPALALLVFMIPLLGIGEKPAIAALFLYSLLPIVRNTHAGLTGVGDAVIEAAEAMGLTPGQRLRLIELPIASRTILAGIKTSAVINVGTATLGALIGAGGYGQPILTGIRLNDMHLILQGALPAAVMAIAVQALFDLSDRVLIPAGLRLREDG
jgi:osmoprotectant transport system permease protein